MFAGFAAGSANGRVAVKYLLYPPPLSESGFVSEFLLTLSASTFTYFKREAAIMINTF